MEEITQRLIKVLEYSREFGVFNTFSFEKRVGLSAGTVIKWTKGKSASMETVVKVLKAFPGISAEWLLRGEGTMTRIMSETTKRIAEQKAIEAHQPMNVDYEELESPFAEDGSMVVYGKNENAELNALKNENAYLREQLATALDITRKLASALK